MQRRQHVKPLRHEVFKPNAHPVLVPAPDVAVRQLAWKARTKGTSWAVRPVVEVRQKRRGAGAPQSRVCVPAGGHAWWHDPHEPVALDGHIFKTVIQAPVLLELLLVDLLQVLVWSLEEDVPREHHLGGEHLVVGRLHFIWIRGPDPNETDLFSFACLSTL